MNIFDKRPLSLILCIFAVGFCLFSYLSNIIKIILAALSLFFLIIIISARNLRKRLACLSLVTLLISFVFSYVYFDLWFFAADRFTEPVSFDCKVLEIKDYNYKRSLTVKTDNIEALPFTSYKLLIETYDMDTDVNPGDTVSVNCKLENFISNNGFDFKEYNVSRGISAFGECNEIKVVNKGQPSIINKFSEYRQDISDLALNRFGEAPGGLLSTLLLGEKDHIDGELLLNFERIGISHILALSGMHIAIIVFILSRLLAIFRINKRINIISCCVFTFLFMLLVGFPMSVCRAGLMLIISYVLYLLSGCKDSITSLFIALTVILLVIPYSLRDIGLQLSALATFGILVYAEYINKCPQSTSLLKRALKYIVFSFSISIFSICTTSFISALTFTSISPLSVLSTFIFSIILEIYMAIGIFALVFGGLINLQGTMSFLYEITDIISSALSEPSFATFSSEFTIVKILAFSLTSLFILFAVLNIKDKKSMVCIIIVSLLLMYSASGILTVNETYSDTIEYNNNNGEGLLLKSGGKTAYFDVSSHRSNTLYTIDSFISQSGVVSLDYFYFISYSSYLEDFVISLTETVKVQEIYLPMPLGEKEDEIATNIFSGMQSKNTELHFYKPSEGKTVGNIRFIPGVRSRVGDGALVCAFSFMYNNKLYSYISNGALENTYYAYELMSLSSSVIFGSFGREYKNEQIIYEKTEKLENIIINSKKLSLSDEMSSIPDLNIKYNENNAYLID